MRLKFFFLTAILLFARGCDFYSTSLWFLDNPKGETNPLFRFFGLGWTGLYVLTRVTIVGSFLAVFHNICQFYDLAFYKTFREIVGRPLYVIYGIIVSSSIYFLYQLWNKEYQLTIHNSISKT